MTKRLLILPLMGILLLSVPISMVAASAEAFSIEQTIEEEITISVNGQGVVINGAQGQTLEVVSLTGRRVMTLKIESPAQRVELNVPKGCYILKIGKVVRKVAIQ